LCWTGITPSAGGISHGGRHSDFIGTAPKTRSRPYLDFVELIVRHLNSVLRTGPRRLSASDVEADHVEHCDRPWTEK
jgi:hypothetical protein